MATLNFIRTYRSVKAFPRIELPRFTLITGVNGSGKTHLLEAILLGAVAVDGVTANSHEIRHYDWNSFVPQSEGQVGAAQFQVDRDVALGVARRAFEQYGAALIQAAQQAGIPIDPRVKPQAIAKLDLTSLKDVFGDYPRATTAYARIEPIIRQISDSIRNGLANSNVAAPYIDTSLQRTRTPLAAYDEEILNELVQASRGASDLFRQSFGRIFYAYREKLIANGLMELRRQQGECVKPMSAEEFEKTYGPRPWAFLNEVLATARLDFEIEAPSEFDLSSYHAKLIKKTDDAEVDFSHLSSGEKVLMSFANCIYTASNDRLQTLPPPKLLLLDEVDAPLHPSMARMMVNVITETLVGRLNVAVIAATHSPATVAVAPDDAIYVMESANPGLRKATKGQALNLLTAGVPTLAINFSGRRQVFVESEIDAKIYDALYGVIRPRLDSERSLSFLSTGSRASGGDRGTGCDQVRRLVSELESTGNHSVLGLIDWDGTNTPKGRIRVLSHGTRNGLENCLFDPLLVACLIARDVPDRAAHIGLSQRGGISQMQRLPAIRLQPIVEAVETMVLGSPGSARTKAKYAGGFELDLSAEYLTMDDHELEAQLLSRLPRLKQFGPRAGALLSHMAERVVPDFLDYVPMDFLDVFSELLTAELE